MRSGIFSFLFYPAWALPALLALATFVPAAAQECDSPPVAVDDEAFHEGRLMVIDVLANDLEPDGEALTLIGFSDTCAGTLSENFGLVSLDPPPLVSEDCTIDYVVTDERGNQASATVFVRLTGQIFEDGFESGDTGGWGGP